MKAVDLIAKAIPLEKAIEVIKANNEIGFTWIPVKLPNGFLIEIGGRLYKDTLDVKAYIPQIENGHICTWDNEFVRSLFAVEWRGEFNDVVISLSYKYITTDITSFEQFLQLLHNCNNISYCALRDNYTGRLNNHVN